MYQLADPNPLTIDELLTIMGEATGKSLVRIPLTRRLAKFAVEKVPGVYQLLRIPSDAIDYFVHPTFYDTTNASTDLEGTGVNCPRISTYLPSLVEFMRAHPEVSSAAMI